MRHKILASAGIIIGLCVVCSDCQRSEPIDSDTALGLLKDRNTEPVRLTFSASIPSNGSPAVMDAYTKLIDAHVITCTNTSMGKICQPGPAGDALTQVGASELALTAGRWVPSTITSISKSAGGSATAEVRMQFELSPLYREFENAFDSIQLWSGKSAIESKKEGKMSHAVFQREEDGWHLQSVSL